MNPQADCYKTPCVKYEKNLHLKTKKGARNPAPIVSMVAYVVALAASACQGCRIVTLTRAFVRRFRWDAVDKENGRENT